jgi:hypothetical protein
MTIEGIYDYKNISLVFVGTSSTYRSNIPMVVDEVAGVNSYNVTTSAQTFISSYYLLKEIMKYNGIDCVVLHMNIARFQEDFVDSTYQYQAINNMKWSMDKLDFYPWIYDRKVSRSAA